MKTKLRTPKSPTRKLAAKAVREARAALGWSRERTEHESGISARTIGSMERGDVPMRALELVIGLRLAAAGPSREEPSHAPAIALVVDGAASRLTKTQKAGGAVAFGACNEKAAGLLQQPITPHTASRVRLPDQKAGSKASGVAPERNGVGAQRGATSGPQAADEANGTADHSAGGERSQDRPGAPLILQDAAASMGQPSDGSTRPQLRTAGARTRRRQPAASPVSPGVETVAAAAGLAASNGRRAA